MYILHKVSPVSCIMVSILSHFCWRYFTCINPFPCHIPLVTDIHPVIGLDLFLPLLFPTDELPALGKSWCCYILPFSISSCFYYSSLHTTLLISLCMVVQSCSVLLTSLTIVPSAHFICMLLLVSFTFARQILKSSSQDLLLSRLMEFLCIFLKHDSRSRA